MSRFPTLIAIVCLLGMLDANARTEPGAKPAPGARPAPAAAPGPALAAATSGPSVPAAAAPRDGVRKLLFAYAEAVNKANAAALMNLYSRKPGVASIDSGEIARGREAIQALAGRLKGEAQGFKMSLGSADVTPLGTEHALAVAPYTLTIATARGRTEIQGALSLVLEKTAGDWKILHEHATDKTAE
jgi:ketosteroid isomerase-like protein